MDLHMNTSTMTKLAESWTNSSCPNSPHDILIACHCGHNFIAKSTISNVYAPFALYMDKQVTYQHWKGLLDSTRALSKHMQLKKRISWCYHKISVFACRFSSYFQVECGELQEWVFHHPSFAWLLEVFFCSTPYKKKKIYQKRRRQNYFAFFLST